METINNINNKLKKELKQAKIQKAKLQEQLEAVSVSSDSDSETEIDGSDVSCDESSDSDDDSYIEYASADESNVCMEEHEINNKGKKETLKEKLKKLSFDEMFLEITNIINEEIQLESEVSELNKQLIIKEKRKNVIRKQKNKLLVLFPKIYIDGCNKARKEKKKRINKSQSGILKENAVPSILIKFLKIPEDTLLMRPKVFSLLNNKFKELGLKKGQDTILDKETANLFGLPVGHIIGFRDCQNFLAGIYRDAKPVPASLMKFLKIPETTLRSTVLSLLTNKFKELGLTKENETILDNETAILFGLTEGHIIINYHTFLADIYGDPKKKEIKIETENNEVL